MASMVRSAVRKRGPRKDNIHRLNLELGPKASAALAYLTESMGDASQAEAIRRALLFASKLSRASRGGAIILRNADGVESLVTVL